MSRRAASESAIPRAVEATAPRFVGRLTRASLPRLVDRRRRTRPTRRFRRRGPGAWRRSREPTERARCDPGLAPRAVAREHRDIAELQAIADQLPGVPVRVHHGGPIVGRVISARRDIARVVAELALDEVGIKASATHPEISLGYSSRLDADNYQRGIGNIDEVSLVGHGLSGGTRVIRGRLDEYEVVPRESIASKWSPVDPGNHRLRACAAYLAGRERLDDSMRRALREYVRAADRNYRLDDATDDDYVEADQLDDRSLCQKAQLAIVAIECARRATMIEREVAEQRLDALDPSDPIHRRMLRDAGRSK